LKNNKSPGADNIGSKILKDIVCDIIYPLSHIFNLSFVTGVVPHSLKLAKVILVYKRGDRSDPGNYRPIFLLSVFDKILEKLMCKRLCFFLQLHNVLYSYQFGFRKYHSTTFALIDVIDGIYQHLDSDEYTIGIYLDLQKAFDTGNHDVLLYKLNNYGIKKSVYQWFKNYLSDRKQFTSLPGVSSEIGYISIGVPQGSVLGPLLFLLYVNDIHQAVLDAEVKLFADDTNLFLHNKKLCTVFDRANTCLQHMSKWLIANRLSLNVDQTCFCVFGNERKIIMTFNLS